jgi:hypothetical protein
MNHLSKCLYGILAIVCFASCNKNSDPAPTDDPVQPDTLLSKTIVWNANDAGSTPFTQEFVFDDQKRVKMIIKYNSDTNGVQLPAAKTDTSLQFFYNGAERNAYRTIGYSYFYTSTKGDVLHFYNSNNQIIKDSIYSSPTSYRSRTYTYSSDKLIIYDTTITNILPPGYKRDTFQIVNNNIAYAKFAFPPGIGYDVFDLGYDNKINPLTKLNIASNILLEGGQAFDKNPYLSPGYCKNNMTQRVGKRSQSTTESPEIDMFQYTYNEINLPVYCKISYSVYTTSSGRVKYLYTH